MKKPPVTTITDKTAYADGNETPAPKRAGDVRFSDERRLYQPPTASTVKLSITRDKLRK
jgi:hypothetical protein